MIRKLFRYLFGVLRKQLSVVVELTGDVMSAEKELGNDKTQRWTGKVSVISQRTRIHLKSGKWWLPSWTIDTYGVRGEIVSEDGDTVTLPHLAFPNILPFPAITGKLSHSVAIELFLRAVATIGD